MTGLFYYSRQGYKVLKAESLVHRKNSYTMIRVINVGLHEYEMLLLNIDHIFIKQTPLSLKFIIDELEHQMFHQDVPLQGTQQSSL